MDEKIDHDLGCLSEEHLANFENIYGQQLLDNYSATVKMEISTIVVKMVTQNKCGLQHNYKTMCLIHSIHGQLWMSLVLLCHGNHCSCG